MNATTELKERRAAIIRQAVQELGEQQAVAWFQTAKVVLGRKTPIEVMATEKGCQQVEALLSELWK